MKKLWRIKEFLDVFGARSVEHPQNMFIACSTLGSENGYLAQWIWIDNWTKEMFVIRRISVIVTQSGTSCAHLKPTATVATIIEKLNAQKTATSVIVDNTSELCGCWQFHAFYTIIYAKLVGVITGFPIWIFIIDATSIFINLRTPSSLAILNGMCRSMILYFCLVLKIATEINEAFLVWFSHLVLGTFTLLILNNLKAYHFISRYFLLYASAKVDAENRLIRAHFIW